jgi:hypothetical protein
MMPRSPLVRFAASPLPIQPSGRKRAYGFCESLRDIQRVGRDRSSSGHDRPRAGNVLRDEV